MSGGRAMSENLQELSRCHKAEVRVSTSGEGTSYYICELCQEPCDVWAGDTQSELADTNY